MSDGQMTYFVASGQVLDILCSTYRVEKKAEKARICVLWAPTGAVIDPAWWEWLDEPKETLQ